MVLVGVRDLLHVSFACCCIMAWRVSVRRYPRHANLFRQVDWNLTHCTHHHPPLPLVRYQVFHRARRCQLRGMLLDLVPALEDAGGVRAQVVVFLLVS